MNLINDEELTRISYDSIEKIKNTLYKLKDIQNKIATLIMEVEFIESFGYKDDYPSLDEPLRANRYRIQGILTKYEIKLRETQLDLMSKGIS